MRTQSQGREDVRGNVVIGVLLILVISLLAVLLLTRPTGTALASQPDGATGAALTCATDAPACATVTTATAASQRGATGSAGKAGGSASAGAGAGATPAATPNGTPATQATPTVGVAGPGATATATATPLLGGNGYCPSPNLPVTTPTLTVLVTLTVAQECYNPGDTITATVYNGSLTGQTLRVTLNQTDCTPIALVANGLAVKNCSTSAPRTVQIAAGASATYALTPGYGGSASQWATGAYVATLTYTLSLNGISLAPATLSLPFIVS